MDARTASYEATAELLKRFFPASYELLRPGVTAETRVEKPDGAPVRIAFADREERGALRLFLRALRLLPEELPWEAVVYSKTGAVPTLRSSLRHRVQIVDDEDLAFTGADIVVAASLGQVTAPGVLVRALGAGRVPLAARVPVYEEVLRDGDLGALFQVGDVERAGLPARAADPRGRPARRAWPSAAPPRARSSRGARSPTRSRRSTSAWPRCATTATRSPRSARGWRATS